jgi:hypothetical protein
MSGMTEVVGHAARKRYYGSGVAAHRLQKMGLKEWIWHSLKSF